MFPSIVHDAKGPLLHLSCVPGTPPLVISLRPCLSCGEAAAAPFQEWAFLSNNNKSWRFWMRCASGMWALWEQHHPPTQTNAIDFSVNSTKIGGKKKREKENKRGTLARHTRTGKSRLLNNSLVQSVDTALTKYSTLRIVHIGRTEEGGKTCGPAFLTGSHRWSPLKEETEREREKKEKTHAAQLWRITTRLDVYFP